MRKGDTLEIHAFPALLPIPVTGGFRSLGPPVFRRPFSFIGSRRFRRGLLRFFWTLFFCLHKTYVAFFIPLGKAKKNKMSKASELLKPYRDQIDQLDDQIVDLLVKRLSIVRDVAIVKAKAGIPVVIEERIKDVIDRVAERAGEENEDMICEVYALLMAVCCDLEEESIGQGKKFKD